MKVTTGTRYGTRAMLDLALNYESGLITSKGIADHQQVSVKYLEILLATLRKAGLVRSVRGAQGGHTLARPPGKIDLREIFEALEGPEGLVECATNPQICNRSQSCVTQPVWAAMHAACMGVLEGITLDDLARRAQEKQKPPATMYCI